MRIKPAHGAAFHTLSLFHMEGWMARPLVGHTGTDNALSNQAAAFAVRTSRRAATRSA